MQQHLHVMLVNLSILSFILKFLLVCTGGCSTGCGTTSDGLSFSETNGDRNDVFINTHVKICCCASGFTDRIKWFRGSKEPFQHFSPNSSNYVFQQDNQILTIHKVTDRDKGQYRCLATNETHNITFDFNLVVHDCQENIQEIVVKTQPAPEVRVGPGDKPFLECGGYVECGELRVYWRKRGKGGKRATLKGNNSHYSVKTVNHRNRTEVSSTLTFNKVTNDNFTSNYTCVIYNGYVHSSIKVKLIKKDEKWVIWTLLRPVLLSSLVGVLIFVAVVAVYRRRGVVLFWMKTKFQRLPKRYASGEVDHDITVLCSLTNEDFVRENVVSVLRRFGYSVYFHADDGRDGRPDVVTLLEGLNRSSHGLVYLSRDEEIIEYHDFFMHSAVSIHGGSRVIVVHQGSLSQTIKNVRSDLRRKLKIVKRVQWPDNIGNKRVRENFWSSVRSCLPEVRGPTQ